MRLKIGVSAVGYCPAMGTQPGGIEQDSRGILDPGLLRQRVRLTRYPATAALDPVIDRFWAVSWDLPDGVVHRQQVLTHPGANISVGHPSARPGDRAPGPVEAQLYGVARTVSTRILLGRGWTVAAMTRPGGLGAFLAGPAADLTNRVVPLGTAIAVDDDALVAAISATRDDAGQDGTAGDQATEDQATEDQATRVALLAAALEHALDAGRVAAAAQVTAAARIAETNREVRGLADLCAAVGIGPRTLQRLFLRFAGVPPTWVIRRYRLIDAAEAVRGGRPVSWAGLAADLGYSDQAHLIRDFRAAIGQTPAAYADAQAAISAGTGHDLR